MGDINKLPNYYSVNNALLVAGIALSASEMHGWLVGLFSARLIKPDEDSARVWTMQSLGLTTKKQRVQAHVLEELYQATYPNLIDSDFSFELLLPDDDEVEENAHELSNWCRGFLNGLAMADFSMDEFINEDCIESFRIIREISELNFGEIKFANEDDAAFSEAVGYVRLSALTIYMEIQQTQRSGQEGVKYLH